MTQSRTVAKIVDDDPKSGWGQRQGVVEGLDAVGGKSESDRGATGPHGGEIKALEALHWTQYLRQEMDLAACRGLELVAAHCPRLQAFEAVGHL